jgi:hypothetical protein
MWFSSFSYSEYICDAKKIIMFYFPAVLLLIPNISSSVNWGVPHGLHKVASVSLSLTASIYRAHKLAYVPSLLFYTPWLETVNCCTFLKRRLIGSC